MKQISFTLSILCIAIFISGCSLFPTEEDIIPLPSSTNDLILISFPSPEQKITSPLVVTGKARGNWFFEATAPLILVDWDGKIIAQSYIQAITENWMTVDFVPFEGTLTFELPETIPYRRGAIIFQKSNASGLPENNDAIEIPIEFE